MPMYVLVYLSTSHETEIAHMMYWVFRVFEVD